MRRYKLSMRIHLPSWIVRLQTVWFTCNIAFIQPCVCVCLSVFICALELCCGRILFDFLFGCHFAISIDCCYYLVHLWYCNGFHCQGQITTAQADYIVFVYFKRLLFFSSFVLMCKSVTTVSIRFIRYKYETKH